MSEYDFLQQPYSRDTFLGFLGRLDFTEYLSKLPVEAEVNSMYNLGHVTTANKKKVAVYEVYIKSNTRLARNRVGLRNLILRQIKRSAGDGAFAVFVDKKNQQWRLSFISIQAKFDAKGNIKVKESPSKRYTYLLGKDIQTRTVVEQLGKIDKSSSLNDIEAAFAVEPLTKEFYQKLYKWYENAQERVIFPNDEKAKDHKQIALIRLITRLLFVWFIKEKGLVNPDLFDKEELQDVIDWKKPSSYYKAILQNLFFATLNRPIGDRGFSTGSSHFVTNLYRYHQATKTPLFKIAEDRIRQLFANTPFLNGGLFECLDRELLESEKRLYPKRLQNSGIRMDGFSNNPKNPLSVPNELFFNGSEEGLIDLFKQYQFTAEESTSVDIEVALDPELLGKIFENLLASYNPDTQKQARKESGSFYTPREIVDYMVNESVKQYCLRHSQISKEKIKMLFSDEIIAENMLSEEEAKEFINIVDGLKILDPAVGSGAFAMGALHKLIDLLNKVDPKNRRYKRRQLEKARKIEDPESQRAAIDAIEKVFSSANEYNSYGRKLYLIENCLYGVDNLNIAIQICKLRFFISLAIEQTINLQDKDNLGVRPLPNLEIKFIAADSLVGITSYDIFALLDKLGELRTIRHKYYNAKTLDTKRKYRGQDDQVRESIKELMKKGGNDEEFTKQIVEWDPYNQNAIASWFDPKFQLDVQAGFDIVIGNPPYIQLQSDHLLSAKYAKQNYNTFAKTGDTYQLFYEKGHNLLGEKGVLCFITSNKWMRTQYGEQTRKYLANHTCPLTLIDLGPDVFKTATVDTNILVFSKRPVKEHIADALKMTSGNSIDDLLDEKKTLPFSPPIDGDIWVILTATQRKIKSKIEKAGKLLMDWNINMNRGVTIGCNKAFVINDATREQLVKKDPKNEEIIKSVLAGADIRRYQANKVESYLINLHNGLRNSNLPRLDVENYPMIKKHLDRYWDKIKNRADQGDTPYNLRNCAYLHEFDKEKIVWQRVTQEPRFAISSPVQYVLDSAAFLSGFDKSTGKYLLAILNSKLIKFWVHINVHEYGNSGYLLSNQYVEKIPVPQISKKDQRPFVDLTNDIIKRKATSADTTDIEQELDRKVCDLYGLSVPEIKIIINFKRSK